MRKFVSLFLILVFVGIYYFSAVEDTSSLAFKSKSALLNVVNKASSKNSTQNYNVNDEMLKKNSPQPQEQTSEDSTEKSFVNNLSLLPTERFIGWIVDESVSMNSTQNNTEELSLRLTQQAQTLSVNQLNILLQIAQDLRKPINERIFSAYVVTLNQSNEATDLQFNLAKAALPDVGTPLPHTEAELRHTQELAIKYMQVDKLAAQAKTNANALDKLKLLSVEAESEQVRNYVLKKLKDLKF